MFRRQRSYYRDGLKAEEAGDLRTALGLFRKAVEKDEEILPAARRLLDIANSLDDSESGLLACDILLRNDSTDALAQRCRGYFLDFAGQYEAASAEWRKASELDPAHKDPPVGMASALMSLGRYHEAASIMRDYLKRFPDSGIAWYALGGCYFNFGDYKLSIEANEKAITYGYRRDWALVEIGTCLFRQGEHLDAITRYRQVEPGGQWYAEARLGIGACLEMIGQLEHALAEYQAAFSIDPRCRLYAEHLLGVLQKLDRLDEITRFINQLDAETFDNAWRGGWEGVVLGLRGEIAAALPKVKRAHETYPDDTTWLWFLGQDYASSDDLDAATECVGKLEALFRFDWANDLRDIIEKRRQEISGTNE